MYGKGVKIDFGKLLDIIKQNNPTYEITTKIAFMVSTNLQESRGFRMALEKRHGFTIFSKTVPADKLTGGQEDPGTDWDVGLALKTADLMLALEHLYDVLILASGDGDFVDLVNYLRVSRPGIRIEVASFRASMSHFLIKAVDHFYELGENVVLIPEPA
jgi:uncharacterized LabA/DUF88 family protein